MTGVFQLNLELIQNANRPLKSTFCGINDLKISNFEIANVVKSKSAFAYAKFSDRRQKDEDEEDSKKGSSAARRAAMEETVGKDEKKRRKSQKIVENPTNKMKPVSNP